MRVLYTDGGSQGNGGADQRARMAVFDDELARVVVDSELGSLTNNEAEYRAIEAALDYAAQGALGPVEIRSDSKLCVSQIRGEWKVKEPRLLPMMERCRAKLAANRGQIVWVPRDKNRAGRFLEGLEQDAALETTEGFQQRLGFCLRCGTALQLREADHRPRPTCPSCGFVLFVDPKVAVAAVLEVEGGILLCRRAIEPGLGKWSFPAGFVDRGEELRSALEREIAEETGLAAELGRLVGVYSEEGNPVVLVVYAARGSGAFRPSAEASELGVFPLDAPLDLAFAHDQQILADWRKVIDYA